MTADELHEWLKRNRGYRAYPVEDQGDIFTGSYEPMVKLVGKEGSAIVPQALLDTVRPGQFAQSTLF